MTAAIPSERVVDILVNSGYRRVSAPLQIAGAIRVTQWPESLRAISSAQASADCTTGLAREPINWRTTTELMVRTGMSCETSDTVSPQDADLVARHEAVSQHVARRRAYSFQEVPSRQLGFVDDVDLAELAARLQPGGQLVDAKVFGSQADLEQPALLGLLEVGQDGGTGDRELFCDLTLGHVLNIIHPNDLGKLPVADLSASRHGDPSRKPGSGRSHPADSTVDQA